MPCFRYRYMLSADTLPTLFPSCGLRWVLVWCIGSLLVAHELSPEGRTVTIIYMMDVPKLNKTKTFARGHPRKSENEARDNQQSILYGMSMEPL